MRLAAILVLGIFVSVGSAQAQIDCSVPGTCSVIKYGLGTDPDFRMGKVPFDLLEFNHGDFGPNLGGISYYHNRGDFFGDQLLCGPERVFNPLPGQVLLNEVTSCTPSSEGPKCAAGTNVGKSCHLGAPAGFAAIECPGSTCQETAGTSCRVEIPISDAGKSPPSTTSEYWILTLTGGVIPGLGAWDLSASTGNTFGGTSAQKECSGGSTPRAACNVNADCPGGGTCVDCHQPNIRQRPAMGTRYLLPADRRAALGLPAGATYVRWDKGLAAPAPGQPDTRIASSTAFRVHQDDAAVCCNSVNSSVCPLILPGSSNYPIFFRPSCTTSSGTERLINEDNIVPDWVFEGSRTSRFFTDPEFQLPGQQHGVCLANRGTACTRPGTYNTASCTAAGAPFRCCTGPAAGTCGNECPSGDSCDFRERGVRIQVRPLQIRNANGDPVATACGSALAVLRGKPATDCTITPRFPVNGDPGPDCGVLNYGVDHRDDLNCDGTADFTQDRCPFLSEWDQDKDSDGDCALPGGVDADCRGDECECGDSNLNGTVNVTDLVQANLMIFGAATQQRIADANSDLRVNVSDIVGQNQEIFLPDSSTCRHITSIRCGNNVLDSGEACDNGARCTGGATPNALCDASGVNTCGAGTCDRRGGDGCNTACRVERGFTCSGSPSVCNPTP